MQEEKRKLYLKNKNTYDLLINENKLKEIRIYDNKIYLNVLIDKNYNKHLILSKKELNIKNNIYSEKYNLKKNNKKSKDYRLNLNYLFSKLFIFDNSMYFFKVVTVNNINCFEFVFI